MNKNTITKDSVDELIRYAPGTIDWSLVFERMTKDLNFYKQLCKNMITDTDHGCKLTVHGKDIPFITYKAAGLYIEANLYSCFESWMDTVHLNALESFSGSKFAKKHNAVSLKNFLENTTDWHDIQAVNQFLMGYINTKPVKERLPKLFIVDITFDDVFEAFGRINLSIFKSNEVYLNNVRS